MNTRTTNTKQRSMRLHTEEKTPLTNMNACSSTNVDNKAQWQPYQTTRRKHERWFECLLINVHGKMNNFKYIHFLLLLLLLLLGLLLVHNHWTMHSSNINSHAIDGFETQQMVTNVKCFQFKKKYSKFKYLIKIYIQQIQKVFSISRLESSFVVGFFFSLHEIKIYKLTFFVSQNKSSGVFSSHWEILPLITCIN